MVRTPSLPSYPFTALVGQEAMCLALLLNVVDESLGGALLLGHRGTGKSTAVRALAELLPPREVIEGCPLRCAPGEACAPDEREGCRREEPPRTRLEPVPVVDLPLGAGDDRVTGSLDLEAALIAGRKRFEPGLLARAHRGFLYIDEVNLLEDHLVDLLLDVAASGENLVEREGLSVRHPARFVLVGSGNPEEGELRPQLLDRFGLSARIVTEEHVGRRVEITRRRLAFERDPEAFVASFEPATAELRSRLLEARRRREDVPLDGELLETVAALNAELEIPGHRGELALARAARASAALEGRSKVTPADLQRCAPLALEHRLRSDAFDDGERAHRLTEALERRFGVEG